MIKFLFFSILMLPHLIFSQYSLYFGDFDYNAKTFPVYIENDEPVGGFQFQLTGLNLKGSSFNFSAKTINPVNGSLSIILGNEIQGNIKLTPEMLLKIQAENALFDTTSNLMSLKGRLHIENNDFSVFGSFYKITALLENNDPMFIFLSSATHKIKKKAEQIACQKALNIID